MIVSKNNNLIIPGYNGIMDLDLTNIPEHLHKETIALHQNDIKLYLKEQDERPEHLRYEYVMKRVNRIFENNKKLNEKIVNKIKNDF